MKPKRLLNNMSLIRATGEDKISGDKVGTAVRRPSLAGGVGPAHRGRTRSNC